MTAPSGWQARKASTSHALKDARNAPPSSRVGTTSRPPLMTANSPRQRTRSSGPAVGEAPSSASGARGVPRFAGLGLLARGGLVLLRSALHPPRRRALRPPVAPGPPPQPSLHQALSAGPRPAAAWPRLRLPRCRRSRSARRGRRRRTRGAVDLPDLVSGAARSRWQRTRTVSAAVSPRPPRPPRPPRAHRPPSPAPRTRPGSRGCCAWGRTPRRPGGPARRGARAGPGGRGRARAPGRRRSPGAPPVPRSAASGCPSSRTLSSSSRVWSTRRVAKRARRPSSKCSALRGRRQQAHPDRRTAGADHLQRPPRRPGGRRARRRPGRAPAPRPPATPPAAVGRRGALAARDLRRRGARGARRRGRGRPPRRPRPRGGGAP